MKKYLKGQWTPLLAKVTRLDSWEEPGPHEERHFGALKPSFQLLSAPKTTEETRFDGTHIIPVLARLRQENWCEFKSSLGYIVSSKQEGWNTYQNLVSKTEETLMRDREERTKKAKTKWNRHLLQPSLIQLRTPLRQPLSSPRVLAKHSGCVEGLGWGEVSLGSTSRRT